LPLSASVNMAHTTPWKIYLFKSDKYVQIGFDRSIDAAVVLDWVLNPQESEPVDD
jgi:hypothetical protein